MKTKKQPSFFLLAALLACITSVNASATKLPVSGSTRHTLNGNEVTLYMQQITSNSPSNTHSGTVRVQLWATRSQHTGGTINGYKTAEIELGVFNGGQSFREINRTVYGQYPSSGVYYMTIILAEYNNGKFFTKDWKNYPRTQAF